MVWRKWDCIITFSNKFLTILNILDILTFTPLISASTNVCKGIISLVHTQIFPKNLTFVIPWYVHTCAYQGIRNVSFSKNFGYVLNEWCPGNINALNSIKCVKYIGLDLEVGFFFHFFPIFFVTLTIHGNDLIFWNFM